MVDFYQRGVTGFEQGRQRAVRNRLNELTQIALTSPPELQRGIAAEMARVDAATGQQFAEQARAREMERLRAQAAFMQSASPEVQQRIYGAMRPSLQNLGLDAPEQFNTNMIEPIRAALFNIGGSGVPASLQEFNALTGIAGATPEERAEAAKVRLGLRGRAPSAGFGWREVQIGDQKVLIRTNPMTGETEYANLDGAPMGRPQDVRVDLSGLQPESIAETRALIEADRGRRFTDDEWMRYTGQTQPQIVSTNTVDLAARTAAAQENAKTQVELAAAPARAAAAGQTKAAEAAGTLAGQREAQPLPADALAAVMEREDAVSTATGLQRRLDRWKSAIERGDLRLDPVLNLRWEAELASGRPSRQAINYREFRDELESIRNDVLRLNKGVQTEGDAQRAMNEIVANLSSGSYVSQRLNTLINQNRRAEQLQRQQIERIRQNYAPQQSQRPRAQNDAGEIVEWDGTNWVRVQ